MKRFMLSLFAALFILLLVNTAQADLMSYKFVGNVTSITDLTGIIADNGLTIGSYVEYTFFIDFDKDGTETKYNGTVYTWTDGTNKDYFYADYISGSALQAKNGGYWSTNNLAADAERNWGLNAPTASPGYKGIIHGNSAD